MRRLPVAGWFVIGELLASTACERAAQTPRPAANGPHSAQAVIVGGNVWFQPDSEHLVAVRDFDVELRKGDTSVAHATTGPEGRFRLKATAGTYRLCWNRQHGWTSGCAQQMLDVHDHAVAVDPVTVLPEGTYAWGTAMFRNGAVAVHRDPLFGVASYPTVEVENGPSTLVNAFGQYVLTGISKDSKEVRIRAEGGIGTAPLARESSAQKIVLKLPSDEPTASDEVRHASPGARLILTAKARGAEHDQLSYQWQTTSGTLSATSGPSVNWTAPASPGRYAVHVMAANGQGGYHRKTFQVRVLAGATAGPACLTPTTLYTCPPSDPNAPTIQCANGIFLNRHTSNQTASAVYYANVDPKGNRATLQQWWALAGFSTTGGGGTRASYMNDNDLGFGRDMHIIKTSNGVFAYVTNFLNQCRLQDPANAQLAIGANPADATATVCMEYSSTTYDLGTPGGSDRLVKFFVYGPDGKRSLTAALDPSGAVPIPNLCLNCHGGTDYDETKPGGIDLGARFLPFDLNTFQFDRSIAQPDYRSFHDLNDLVVETTKSPGVKPVPTPITELVNLWYPTAGSDIPVLTPHPGDWNQSAARQKLYDLVVARSCRTCHMAFDTNGGPTWAGYSQFEKARRAIKFETGLGDMPHALITFMNLWSANFWSDAKGPGALKCFTDSIDEPAMEKCLAGI